jgi:hypothetical protein
MRGVADLAQWHPLLIWSSVLPVQQSRTQHALFSTISAVIDLLLATAVLPGE